MLFAIAAVLTVLAIAATWVRGQLLDGTRYVDTTSEVLAAPAVQRATAAFLADELMTAPGLQPALQARLPGPAKALAGPLTGLVGDAADRGARRALSSGAFQQAWRHANTLTWRQVAAIVRGERAGGAIVIDLRPMVGQLATRVGFGSRVVATLPEGRGIIRVLSADEVQQVRGAVHALRAATFIVTVLALLALAGGIALAPTRAAGAAGAGATLLVAGALVLVARRIVGPSLIADLSADSATAQAGQAAWWIFTAFLADVAGSVAMLGGLVLAGGWLAGPSRLAARVREPLSRIAVTQPGFVALVACGAATGLLLAGALPWSHSPVAAAVYLVAAAGVVVPLRRSAPDGAVRSAA
jgi:hypothetical protein